MSQRMSRIHMQLAPTLALLRFKCSLVPRKRRRECEGVRADEVIR